MKLIIDIDENIYHRFVNGFANEDDAYLIEQLFKNSTSYEDRSQSEGIPVSEGLPERCKEVIVTDTETGLSKRDYRIMSHASKHPIDYVNTTDIVFRKAVESGIVLPKEHGDLVDRDEFMSKLAQAYNKGFVSWGANEVVKELICSVKTIIEADNAESEE